jgi:glycosyltransferase involved in cell wall biosynthesis
MRILMISLDKHILDPSSRAAARMARYARELPLSIIIPSSEKKSVLLSPNASVCGSGGRGRLGRYWAAYRAAVRIFQEESCNRITVQDPFLAGLVGVLLRRKFRAPLEIQLHGDFFPPASYYRRGTLARRLGYFLARHIVVPRADSIRAAGRRVAESVIALGIPKERIAIRPVSVDAVSEKQYHPERHLHALYPQYARIFLVLGRLDPVKNIRWLLSVFADALQQRPSLGLVIVGDGSEREAIERDISMLGLDASVHLLPWTGDPRDLLATADAVLVPSVSEGYGLVAMEAHMLGTPVIMADVGVAGYELPAGPNVHIIPTNDRGQFIHALLASTL